MNLKNASILVVDDDPDVLTAVRLLLKTEVKEVITEKNPENLRWHLNKDHFDLILLDMNFRSRRGKEFRHLLLQIFPLCLLLYQ